MAKEFKVLKQTGNTNIDSYKTKRNILNKLRRYSKTQHFKEQLKQHIHNSKRLWRTINMIVGQTNDKTSVIEKIKHEQIDQYNPVNIANLFNNYFSNIGTNMVNTIATSNKHHREFLSRTSRVLQSLVMHEVTELELNKIISSLPCKSSSGIDNMSNILIKKIKPTLVKPLMYICNMSIYEGTFPDRMKEAMVVPLYKAKEKYLLTIILYHCY